MTDYMLRTNTESQMNNILKTAGLLEEYSEENNSTVFLPTNGITIDRIGVIPAVFNIDGTILKPQDSGYHVNLRTSILLTEEQENILPIVNPPPTIPYRVFL